MDKKPPNVLIYKRTHKGDPDSNGIFGIHNCMGSIRDREYDAVIGIGGKRPWKRFEGIGLRVNWVGIVPTKHDGSGGKASLVTFSKFCLFDEKGPFVKKIAPRLYKHMYVDAHRRVVMSSSLSSAVLGEVIEILKLADKCAGSKRFSTELKTAKSCR